MSDNKPKWNVIPIKGLEDGDLNKFSMEYLNRSEAQSGKVFSEEAKKNMSQSAKLKKLTEEHKNNIREVTKGNKNPFFGKKHSEEHKNKIGELKKGNKNCVGRVYTEETKNKISKTLSGRVYVERSIPVKCYLYPSMEYIKDYDSLTVAANELNINRECARLTAVGKRNHSGGYTFRYIN